MIPFGRMAIEREPDARGDDDGCGGRRERAPEPLGPRERQDALRDLERDVDPRRGQDGAR